MLSSKQAGVERHALLQVQEEEAAFSFVDKFFNNGFNTSVSLNICALHDALYSLLLKENKQKILILYFHNQGSEFSRSFCSYISNIHVESLLNEHFNILGWDIGVGRFEEVLCNTLNNISQLQPFEEMIRRQESAALFISLIDMNFEICCVMRSTVGLDDFQSNLEILIDCFCINTPDENEEIIDNSGYKDFQQRMLDGLGNRDYDLFESNEMEYLKEKIAFALFGMPMEESGYADKQKEERDKMYDTIIKQSNKYLEYKNQVVISVVYNCLVPLDNNDDNDGYTPVPVFILRKCRESSEPCRIIIDHTRRVYNSWNDYLIDNKICECLMVVPQNGRYSEDAHGKVKLEKLKSPSCKPAKKVLKVTDITSSVLGIGSTGVFAVAAIPAITIAPAALLGAAAVGAGVGIYSLGRSIHTLVDRGSHDESLNVTEAESRAAYINIAGGALGFAGAGANAAVSQLAANGISIGTSARIAVNTLNVANIGVGGLGIGNSAVEIIMRWWIDDERPSTFTVLQLSTSILFFGHAVYTFRTAGTIIEEAQNNYLNDYRKYLRSNKHRKMFKN